MINISFILVPMAVAAFVISYLDYRKNLVKNRYVAVLLVFGFLFQILQGNLMASPLEIIDVFVLGGLISFLLWFVGILPAGDSKLFTSLLLYFPATYYSHGLILDFLINIFVPVFVFMFIYLLLRSGRKEILESLKSSVSPYRVFMVFVVLIGFAWFIYAPLKILGLDVGYFGLVILLFLGYEILLKVSSGKTEVVFVVLAVLRLILDFQNALTLNFLLNTGFIVLFFLFIRFFALSLSFRFYTESKEIKELKPGMNMASGIKELEGKYKDLSRVKSSLVGYLMDRREDYELRPGKLTEENIEKLEDMAEKDKLEKDKVKVFKKQHFSVFLFVGYFLTFVLGTNFVNVLNLII